MWRRSRRSSRGVAAVRRRRASPVSRRCPAEVDAGPPNSRIGRQRDRRKRGRGFRRTARRGRRTRPSTPRSDAAAHSGSASTSPRPAVSMANASSTSEAALNTRSGSVFCAKATKLAAKAARGRSALEQHEERHERDRQRDERADRVDAEQRRRRELRSCLSSRRTLASAIHHAASACSENARGSRQ